MQSAEHVKPLGLLLTLPAPSPPFTRVTVRGAPPLRVKLAVTFTSLLPAGMVQLPVPVHEPPQPANTLPLLGCAVRVIAALLEKLADAPLQSVAQAKPLGLLLTLPVPLPALFKVTKRVLLATLKLAVTLRAALIVTEQLLLVPVQAPPQPAKLLPDAACAVNVTCVPAA